MRKEQYTKILNEIKMDKNLSRIKFKINNVNVLCKSCFHILGANFAQTGIYVSVDYVSYPYSKNPLIIKIRCYFSGKTHDFLKSTALYFCDLE